MTDSYPIEKQNKIRQLATKGSYDKAAVHAIIDAGLVAHVAFSTDDGPVVVPMLHARDGETVYLHGARKARVIRMLEQTARASLNITLVDGIVLARSAFNSSMNYRSVTIFGEPQLIEGHDEKLHAMHCISEHLMPGRWDELREPHEKEVKMTGVIALSIDSASAKVSTGEPEDEDEDYAIPVWAGVLPVAMTTGQLVTDSRVIDGVNASVAVKGLQGKTI